MQNHQPFVWSLLVSALLGTVPVTAALPPVYQRVREIAAVVEIAAPLLEGPIEEVHHVGNNLYEVKDSRCRVEIHIVPQVKRDTPPGPLPFSALPGRVVCR